MARDYLLTRVALANRQRAGAIANITVQAFKNARPSQAQGQTIWTLLTREHKTVGKYGGATIGLEEDLFNLITNFTKKIR